MTFRDDHDAALARARALEQELARTKDERDRLEAELGAARTSQDAARIAELERQLAAARAERDQAQTALVRSQDANKLLARDESTTALAIGISGTFIGAGISLAIDWLVGAVMFGGAAIGIAGWFLRHRARRQLRRRDGLSA